MTTLHARTMLENFNMMGTEWNTIDLQALTTLTLCFLVCDDFGEVQHARNFY